MELRDVISLRRSVRRFSQDYVPIKAIEYILSLARKCPSAGGTRGFRAQITTEKLVYDAPYHIVIFTDPERYAPRYGDRGRELYAVQDATIYGAYIQLLLVDAGMASCWVGAFREGKIKRMFGTNERPVAILAVGVQE